MVQVRRLLDVLSILPRREDERRFDELSFAQPAALCVLPGELQGVQGPVVEQRKPILVLARPMRMLVYLGNDQIRLVQGKRNDLFPRACWQLYGFSRVPGDQTVQYHR